jgi:heptosyltransferase-2
MKILFIQPRVGIGDFILFLPFIKAIAEQEYNPEIYILTKKRTAANQILIHDKKIKIIFVERDGDGKEKHDGIKGFFQLKKLIKSYSFDKAFILHQSCRYALLCKLAGIKNILGYGRNFQFIFLSTFIFNKNFFNKNFNIYEEALSFTKKIIKDKEFNKNAEIVITNKEKDDFYNKYKHNKNNNFIIGIGGSGPTVKWPVENWITLINYLNKNFTINFIIAGGKNDEVELAQLNHIDTINPYSNLFFLEKQRAEDGDFSMALRSMLIPSELGSKYTEELGPKGINVTRQEINEFLNKHKK